MKMAHYEISKEPVETLVPHPKNPRRGNVDEIIESIKVSGFYGTIVAQKGTRHVLIGNHRLEAAKRLGAESVDVCWVDCDDEAALRILLSENRLNDLAGYDDGVLADLLEELAATPLELCGTGYDARALDNLLAGLDRLPGAEGLVGADEVPDPVEEPRVQPGDLLILGDHRLYCADSTNPADVERLMDGKRAKLFATDPPYLVDYNGCNHPHKWGESEEQRKRKNKDWSQTYAQSWDDADQGSELYEGFIRAAIDKAIVPNAAWYCWHASRRQAMLEAVWEKFGAFVHQQIIWMKDRPVLTRSWYMWQHEPCFFGWIRGEKPPRIADNFPSGIWQIPTIAPGTKTEHPTSKPVELFSIPMRQHTVPGDVCYEPFAGSGSQIIAAEMLGRRCFAMEISPAYCDVIVRRWKAFTGKEARHAEG